MTRLRWLRGAAVIGLAAAAVGCAVRPVPDPRNPGMVRNGPVTLRVCVVEGDAAHLAVGDRVEFSTSRLGRLRIRHLPESGNNVVWNGGDDVRVRSSVLVERVDAGAQGIARQQQQQQQQREQRPQQQQQEPSASRRFVPVGRFSVRVGEQGHAKFDFLVGQTTTPTTEHAFPECLADIGDDEVIIRGVEIHERHGGLAILR